MKPFKYIIRNWFNFSIFSKRQRQVINQDYYGKKVINKKEVNTKQMITTDELMRVYGKPNQEGSYLVTIKLPYPMRLAWDTKTVVTRMRCHEKVADEFTAVFNEILRVYGLDQIRALGIDLFGGCFNFRKMRGGSNWSRHSWGVAIDLDPSRNKLRESKKTARFARPEYKKMIDIFYNHGFESLGIEKDYDWMHFQIKSNING